jgi:hypothetical protein
MFMDSLCRETSKTDLKETIVIKNHNAITVCIPED